MEATPKKWEKHTHKLLKGKSISGFKYSGNIYCLKIINSHQVEYTINLIKTDEAIFQGINWEFHPENWPVGEFNLKEIQSTYFLGKKVLEIKIHTDMVKIKVGYFKKSKRKYEEVPTSFLIFKNVDKVILIV